MESLPRAVLDPSTVLTCMLWLDVRVHTMAPGLPVARELLQEATVA